MQPTGLPYALPAQAFRFNALARLAGRAALGGPREVAIAVYLAARLADDSRPTRGFGAAARALRATAARNWLGSLALPATVRKPLLTLVERTGEPDGGGRLEPALRDVMAVTATYLDRGARSELERLARALEP